MIRLFYGILFICCCGVLAVLYALAAQMGIADLLGALLTEETRFALKLSLATSVSSVGISTGLGLPVAYLMARRRFPGKFVVDSLLDIPMVMTPLVTGMGLLFLLGPNIAGQWIQKTGIDFLFTPAGAVLAQTFIATPLVIRSGRVTFEGIDEKYEQAGAMLGLSDARVFCFIVLPMARNGILAGAVLAWARTLGEFGATLMVAGASRMRTETLPIAVYLNLTSGEIELAVACAWLLISLGLVLLMVLKWLGVRQKVRQY
ncbi:ABC transporter permease [Desulfobacter sp.]|uniref:ABC transporter permease n=1 Tax=Desulfobacter sp. TaxID=2294 RepID=UPI003D099DC2